MAQRAVFQVSLPTTRQGGRPLAKDEITGVVLQLATRDVENFYSTIKEWSPEGEWPDQLQYTQQELENGPWFARAAVVTAEGHGEWAKISFVVGDGELQPASGPGLTVDLQDL